MANRVAIAVVDGKPQGLPSGDALVDVAGNVLPFASNTHTHEVMEQKTWAFKGDMTAITYAGFYVQIPTGQTAYLTNVRAKIGSGTSFTCKLTKNGSDITGFTGMVVDSTGINTNPTDVALADGDYIALVGTGISGTPTDLSLTAFILYTVDS
jgi:hypothetical protein